jgi:hypothetical protein
METKEFRIADIPAGRGPGRGRSRRLQHRRGVVKRPAFFAGIALVFLVLFLVLIFLG